MAPVLSTDRSARAATLFLALGIGVIAGWFLLPSGALRAVGLIGFNALAAGAIAFGLWRHRPSPGRPWLVLLVAQAASMLAYAYWYLYPTVTGVVLPVPSVADALFLSLYALSCLAVGMLVRAEGAVRDRRTLIDLVIVTVSIGALSWVFLMAPYANDDGLAVQIRLLSLAYPAFDLLLFILTVRLVINGATPSAAKWLLLAWSTCQLLGDSIYGFELLAGRWSLASPVPSLWMAGFTFVGAAALHPSMRHLSEPVVARAERLRAVVLRTGVVLACASVLPIVLIVELALGDMVGLPVIAAGSFVIFVLALLRNSGTGRSRADRGSIVRLIVGFTVLALLPLGLLALTSIRLAERALEQDVKTRLETTAATSSIVIEREMGGVGDLVSAYAERRMLVAAMGDGSAAGFDRREVGRHLGQLRAVGDGIVGAFTTDATGQVTHVAPEVPGLVGDDLSGRDWFRGASSVEGPYVSRAYRTDLTGPARMAAVAAPVRATEGGRTVGFVVAVYDLGAVQELSNQLARGHGLDLLITDQGGALVAAPGATRRDAVLGADPRVGAALAGRSGVVTLGRGEGAVVSAYTPVEDLGWTVTAEVSRSSAFAPLSRLRSTVLGIATLLGQALFGGLVLLMRSLRHRRDAERTLQASEEHTRAILDAAADAFLSVDDQGTIRAWNDQATALFGWSRDEVLGRRYDEVVPLSDRMRPTVLGERNEAMVRHRDGRRFPVEFVLWSSGSGEDVVLSAFVHDISERRGQEAELAAAHDAAVEASRLKSEFLAVVSHEIRTPMNGVLGMTSLLLSTGLDTEQREYAETIRDSGENLLGLVNDVLDFSKAESGRMELEIIDFSLRHVVRDVTDLLGASAADRGLTLSSDIGAGVPMALCGDPGRLRQILTNLVGNAIKFTSAGSVRLTVGSVAVSGADIVLRFEVADTGIGIADDAVEGLFDAFSQADSSTTRRYGGTGLGLAISRQLVELVGGEIGVTSRPGEGSTFWFTARFAPGVPLSQLPAVELPVAPVAGHRAALVLVAEDNAVNQRIAARMLEKLGHRADVVANGAEAVDALRQVPYDLVFMDCQMPVMDGFTAVAAIRAAEDAAARTPVIAMTASAMEADRLRCLDAGMDDYLSKPVRLHDLAAALTRWLPATSDAAAGDPAPIADPGAELEAVLIDESVVDNLRQLGPGFLAQVVGLFQAGLAERVTALRAAADESNAGALAGLAHSLRGTSGNLGAVEVATTCGRIESLAATDVDDAAALVPELVRQLEATSRVLTRYVAEPVR
jgi:PAS domain S-box-containing protein